jgi:Ribosomal protein S10p/S20e
MNAQISIIIKSFEIKNSQKKETRKNCNEKNRAVSERSVPQASEQQGGPLETCDRQGRRGAPSRSLPFVHATDKAEGALPAGRFPSAKPPIASAEHRTPNAASKNSSAVSKIKSPQTEQTIPFLLRRHLRSIRLPKRRTLYTVLRSPHIDKKSREQFEMKIHKQCFFIQSETKYLRTQLLLLKLQDIPGVQCKIVVNYKTRLGLLST